MAIFITIIKIIFTIVVIFVAIFLCILSANKNEIWNTLFYEKKASERKKGGKIDKK